jgi:curved DNA-binding protein CbpA
MNQDAQPDYYEALQISSSAEPETVHRVYRLLAQKFHPDNQTTGSEARFRQILEAYEVLSDPEKRARYDSVHQNFRQTRFRVISEAAEAATDFEHEQLVRLTVLEVLFRQRRLDPHHPGIFLLDLEQMIGAPREHLEFTLWFLGEKRLIGREDGAKFIITAEGIEYLERHFDKTLQPKRLRARNETAARGAA